MGIQAELDYETHVLDQYYDEYREENKKKEFFNHIENLTKKLKEMNQNKFKVDVSTVVIEKEVKPTKVYNQRYKNFRRNMDFDWKRLGD